MSKRPTFPIQRIYSLWPTPNFLRPKLYPGAAPKLVLKDDSPLKSLMFLTVPREAPYFAPSPIPIDRIQIVTGEQLNTNCLPDNLGWSPGPLLFFRCPYAVKQRVQGSFVRSRPRDNEPVGSTIRVPYDIVARLVGYTDSEFSRYDYASG